MNEHSIATLATLDDGIESALSAANGRQATAELFVINLCASMTPMPSVPKNLKGFEKYKLYQVSKSEDGRRRYRLRLGFFTSEADAELVVSSVRNLYPAAFTGCLAAEDFRFVGETQEPRAAPKAVATAATNVEKQPSPVAPIQKDTVVAAKTSTPIKTPAEPAQPKPVAVTPKPIHSTSSAPIASKHAATPTVSPKTVERSVPQKTVAPPVEEFTFELDQSLPPTAKAAAPAAPTAEIVPFHVAKGIVIPDVALELAPENRSVKPNPAKQPAVQSSATKPAQPPRSKPASAEIPPPPQVIEDYIPILDTTLTLRTLTQAEIDDPNQPTWYVVELALSDHPVNLEAMPKLDIFAAYSLYSVAITTAGTIRHALRLGFFREAVSAEAVCGYLKTFFGSPNVARVSSAEYGRFAESPRKPIAAAPAEKGTDKVVQLNKRAAAPPTPAPAAAKGGSPQIAKPTAPAKPNVKSGSPQAPVKNRPQSLGRQLQEEARKTVLSESAIRKAPKPQSFLSRLIGRSLD